MNEQPAPRLLEHTYEGQTLKAGDFVTAYEKGYHVVTGIVRRFFKSGDYRLKPGSGKSVGDEDSPLVFYRRVISASGNKVTAKPKKELCCCWGFVSKVDDSFIDAQQAAAHEQWEDIRQLREEFLNEPW